MKDGATFINTARGAICDQDALIAELQRDRISAIIDVTDPEVNAPDSPLWDPAERHPDPTRCRVNGTRASPPRRRRGR